MALLAQPVAAAEPADRAPRPQAWTVCNLIDKLAASGERPALAMVRGGEAQYMSGGELARSALGLAAGLLAAGARPGEPVLLMGENGFDWVIARLGLGAMGAVPVAIDPLSSAEEVQAVLAATAARFAFADKSRLALFGEPSSHHRVTVLAMGEAPQETTPVVPMRSLFAAPPVTLPDLDPVAPAMMVFTSGTTGAPKRFLLDSNRIAANVHALQASGLVGAADRVFLPLPLHHAYPLVVGLFTALESGALVAFPESASGHAILEGLRASRATIMVGVPRLYAALLTALESAIQARGRLVNALYALLLEGCIRIERRIGWSPGRLLFRGIRGRLGPSLRLLVSGGAKLDAEIARKLEGLGWQLRSGYGLAETASVFTANTPGSERLGSEGRPLGSGQVRIVAQGSDGSGEVELQGPCIFDSYLDNPEANASAFSADGWFRTGDLGYLDRDGFLFITGRSKEQIVLGGGKKLFPEEAERVYGASPFIAEVAVLERQGALVALVVPKLAAIRNAAVARPEDAVRVALTQAAQHLPSYAHLAGFALTRQPLPRTRLGKYRRFLLPGLYERALAHAEPQAAGPLGAEDRALLAEPAAAALWALLGARFKQLAPTLDSSLQLDLGLDSLGWMALALEIENRLAIRLDDAAVNRILTVRDLLREAVAAKRGGSERSAANPLESQWLQPRGLHLRAVGAIIHMINRAILYSAFQLEVKGADHLPAIGPCIIAPNHVSFLDPPAMAGAFPWRMLPRVRWAADRLLMFSNPAKRLICRAMGIFPVDQRSPASVIASAIQVLREDEMLVWFPEGWRAPTPELLPFQPGIGRLVEETGASVVPAYIFGTYESWPRGSKLPRPVRLRVVFGEPISAAALRAGRPEGDWQAIANALRERVAALGTAAAEQKA